MKLLKRNLAFVLTLAMVLGLMVSASALNIKDYSDYNEITYLEAIDLLTSLGILEGPDGKFNPQDVLTREQGAKIIAYLMLGKEGAEALSTSVAPFKDVASGRWSAGFIAYCASQGIIGGYGNGNFGPTDTLTGNQFAKMLLVALGYGVNGEFTGPNWSIEVAKYALTEGIFDGNLGANFDAGTKREEAALYAFNALTGVMTVSYSETFGTYYSGKLFNSVDKFDEEYTLGYKLYNVKSKDTTDDFGREAHYWVKNSNTKLTETYHEEADAVYTAQVTSAKVYTDLGLTKTANATVIEDGKTLDKTFQVKKGYTNASIGGNGILIEAYVDEDENVTLIKINTYLAQVANVDKGTVKVDFIYGTDFANIDKEFDTAVEYEEDDYVLVTVANGEIQSMVAAESKTGKVTAYADDYVKLGDEKLNKTQVLKDNDTTANDDFYAIDYDSEMKVILDQYGYVIGVVVEEEADTAYSYVLVTDSEGRANSLLNGKAAVVEVMHLDGKTEVLPLQTKKDGQTTQFKFDGSWYPVASREGNTKLYYTSDESENVQVKGWYRYTMTDDGEIVLKALNDKAIGDINGAFEAEGKQLLKSVSLDGHTNKNDFILNSKTVLHVVDEKNNKTYTGYKNIDKKVTNGNVLFVVDGKVVSDIYVLNTKVAEDDIYAYYDGTTYETTKGTWVTLYVNGEAQNYLLGKDNGTPVVLSSNGIYTITVEDNELVKATLKTNANTAKKVTDTSDDYFQVVENDKDVKYYYSASVKVFDITDEGKAGAVANNDTVVWYKADDSAFVTYVYIIEGEDDTTADENVTDGKYTVKVENGAVVISTDSAKTITAKVTAKKFQDGIYAEAETDAVVELTVSGTTATGKYQPAVAGQYVITIKVGNATIGTYGPYFLEAKTASVGE